MPMMVQASHGFHLLWYIYGLSVSVYRYDVAFRRFHFFNGALVRHWSLSE